MPQLWPCNHCKAERIVAPLSELLGMARKHRMHELVDGLTHLLAHARDRDVMASICPGCFCLTTDLYGC